MTMGSSVTSLKKADPRVLNKQRGLCLCQVHDCLEVAERQPSYWGMSAEVFR